jgi:ABC-2 type transport system permease protein
MFWQILLFDLKWQFKKPRTWLFFSAAFLFVVLYLAAFGGLIPGFNEETAANLNSASHCALILNAIANHTLVGTIILIAIMAPAIQKDFHYNSHGIYFTKPISKFGYIVGRFLSGYLTALFVLSGSLLAYILMGNLHIYPSGKFGSYGLWNYFQGFVYFIIPNTLFVGVLFFSIVTYTRNIIAGYVTAIILLMLMNNKRLMPEDVSALVIALKDPYGVDAIDEMAKYWTPEDENKLAVPFTGYFLYNRILWLLISGFLFFLTYFRFSFQQFASPFNLFKRKKTHAELSSATTSVMRLPVVTPIFDMGLSIKQWSSLTKLELKSLIKNPYFIAILIVPSIIILIDGDRTGSFGKRALPTTFRMLDTILAFAKNYADIVLVFFSGALVWRERSSKVDEIVSTMPTKSWVLLFSKVVSLVGMYMITIGYFMLFFICFQLAKGFTDIRPFVYLQALFGYNLFNAFILVCFTVSIQGLVNNRYVGYLICVTVMLLLPLTYDKFGIYTRLIWFNSGGFVSYSDMNGFGNRFLYFIFHKFYWLSFVCILLITSTLMWHRGKEQNFKSRFLFAKSSFRKFHLLGYVFSLMCMILFGSFIHYNTRVLNKFYTPLEIDQQIADLEKNYKKYNSLPKLKIVEVNIQLNIYPDARALMAKGFYWLKNKGTRKVDSLLIKYNKNFDNLKIETSNNSLFEIANDDFNAIKLFKFAKPINSGDSLQLKFSFTNSVKGFGLDAHGNVVGNGTYLSSKDIFPNISYVENWEIADSIKRAWFGLLPKISSFKLEDSTLRTVNYVSPDADWIRYECTVSTSSDQTAISSGNLVKKWNENNRNYFHYKMDAPALLYTSFQSARYEITFAKWKGIDIEVYYDKRHPYNVENMINGVKESLDYYSDHFGAYPFKQLRVVEFPRYIDGAQGFANTLTFSEGRDFVAAPGSGNANSLNCFFTVAHEVAHQWWGHQVVGADLAGNTLIGESLAEYSALKVLEKKFGYKAIYKYLKYELDEYFKKRRRGDNEPVLLYCQDQSEVYYNKASIVLYSICDLIGEQQMNSVLKSYVEKNRFQQAPYTTSLELEKVLLAVTPDSLKYAITDGFEKITFYENMMKDVSYIKLPSGKYKVSIAINARKFYVDANRKTLDAKMSDYIDIVVYGKMANDQTDTKLYNKKHKITSGLNKIEIIVDDEPLEAGIDPFFKLIDNYTEDNRKKVAEELSQLNTIK